MATRDPLADWQAMGQQYWQGLQDLGKQFLKQNPAPQQPWAEGLEQWRTLYQGADTGGVFEQMLTQGKTWLGTLEQLFKAGAAGAGTDLAALVRQSLDQFKQSQPWLGGMGENAQWFDPAQLQQWAQQFAGISGGAHAPAFGFAREQQERLTRLGDDLAQYQRETQRYNALMAKAMESAVRVMESKLQERDEPGRKLSSIKAVYDLWIDALEESYAEVALSPEFREAYGALVNAQMRVRQGVQTQVERSSADLGMPTRSELDGVHRKLADVRRTLRQINPDEIEHLRSEVVELRRELAQLKAATHKTETVVVARASKTSTVSTAESPAPEVAPAAAAKAAPARKRSAAVAPETTATPAAPKPARARKR